MVFESMSAAMSSKVITGKTDPRILISLNNSTAIQVANPAPTSIKVISAFKGHGKIVPTLKPITKIWKLELTAATPTTIRKIKPNSSD